jgi:tRNA G46 methylase TrmB
VRDVFATVIPAGRISRVDVRFPTPDDDPRRRLFSPVFAEDLACALAPDGAR